MSKVACKSRWYCTVLSPLRITCQYCIKISDICIILTFVCAWIILFCRAKTITERGIYIELTSNKEGRVNVILTCFDSPASIDDFEYPEQ